MRCLCYWLSCALRNLHTSLIDIIKTQSRSSVLKWDFESSSRTQFNWDSMISSSPLSFIWNKLRVFSTHSELIFKTRYFQLLLFFRWGSMSKTLEKLWEFNCLHPLLYLHIVYWGFLPKANSMALQENNSNLI